MSSFARAEDAPELLDQERHDTRELAQSLGHVAAVNRWLGGVSALLAHVMPLLDAERTTRILDIGTGSADLPRRVVDWARAHGRRIEIVAADLHPQIRALAAAQSTDYPEISVEAADALALPYPPASFDIVTISLTLHHFDGGQQVRVLREAARVTRAAVIVNELLRTRLNYLGARLLALTLWRGNRLTRHDGPLSVRRAFTAAELSGLGAAAGLNGRVFRHFFQRIVLVARPGAG
ncbi:MAG: methyltransferase domain-containing protein [Gemmatimonadota bacterium]